MQSTTTGETEARNANHERFNAFIRKYAIVFILLAMFIAMSFLTPAFLQPRNLFNVVRQISVMGLIAIGVTMVIITTGIDLSSGSVLGPGSSRGGQPGAAYGLGVGQVSWPGSACHGTSWLRSRSVRPVVSSTAP